jgi:translation initiation factor RLI1
MAYIYRHIRIDNNKPFYVGVGEDIPNNEGKFKRAHELTNRNKHWNNIVNKIEYKIDIILDNLTWGEACKKEIEFISLYGRADIGKGTLVNLTDGGEGKKGAKDTIETKLKKSISAQKPKNEKWKVSQSLSRKGKPRGFLPWLVNNPERSEKIKQSKINKPSLKKISVTQYDKNMNFIQDFPSIKEASMYVNTP